MVEENKNQDEKKEEVRDVKKDEPVEKVETPKKEEIIEKTENKKTETPKKEKIKSVSVKKADKPSKKEESLERIYTIPLLKEWGKVPRYKRAKKAIRAIREFVVQHMKVRDRDLNKVKVDKFLNEEVWFRGIKKPPKKIKVRVVKDSSGIVRVYLVDFKDKLKFKKAREERVSKTAEQKKKEKEAKKSLKEKPEEKKEDSETEEKKEEQKEKAKATVEAGEKLTDMQHKQQKHQVKDNYKEPKHLRRQALKK